MKKLILLLILSVFITGNSHAQTSPKLEVGIFNNVSIRLPNTYWGMGAFAGPQLNMHTGSISIYAMYQFSGNSGTRFGLKLQSHLLGGGFQYRILSREKRFSPYIELTAVTEVGTNYRGGFLHITDYSPTEYGDFVNNGSPNYSYYYSSFYYSTPLVGNILFGCDVRITEGLHLSLGVGYGLRTMKAREIYWDYDEEPSEELRNTKPQNTKLFQVLNAKLGISYAFSFKKH